MVGSYPSAEKQKDKTGQEANKKDKAGQEANKSLNFVQIISTESEKKRYIIPVDIDRYQLKIQIAVSTLSPKRLCVINDA